MFPLEMVQLNVSPSNGPLFICFPSKWYALKSFLLQIAHFIYVSLSKWYALNSFYPIKWPTLSVFPLQMVRLKKFPCQMAHFIDV